MRRVAGSIMLALLLLCLAPATAFGGFGDRSETQEHADHRGVDGSVTTPGKSANPQTNTQGPKTGDQQKAGPQQPKGTKSKPPTAAEIKAYEEALRRYAAGLAVCRNELTLYGGPGMTAADCEKAAGAAPRRPTGEPEDDDPAEPTPPPPDPAVLAQIAVTRLRIPEPVIKIGPPPQINQWKRAFVGYPLWLWGDETGQLTRSVTLDGVTLTLTARRVATRFDMGEPGAEPVFCPTSTEWTRAVEPGAASPTCGYRYTAASMTAAAPHGTYTVTATARWEVTWSAMGQSGVIPLQATAQSALPVGELQTVRRR